MEHQLGLISGMRNRNLMANASSSTCSIGGVSTFEESANVCDDVGGLVGVKCSGGKRKRLSDVQHDVAETRQVAQPDELNKKKRIVGKREQLDKALFKDNKSSEGGKVKQEGAVLKTRAENSTRQPNINCKVEALGRMCSTFDELRKRWVSEMGFKSLFNLCGMRLPRTLCYWLMTRVDPINEMFTSCDNHRYRLSRNQVRWILGIPNGPSTIPTKAVDESMKGTMDALRTKYGKEWIGRRKNTGHQVISRGIPITSKMIERLASPWEEGEEVEFKTLFLMVSLHMVLCPTQGPRLAGDLLPAVTYALNSHRYDWCQLVITKLMDNIRSFSKRFYAEGFAGGGGGCSIFLAIFYLDRLDRNPLCWNKYPRIKVWSFDKMKEVCAEDRVDHDGDYGAIGCLDVAYGERHPRDARDTEGPPLSNDDW